MQLKTIFSVITLGILGIMPAQSGEKTTLTFYHTRLPFLDKVVDNFKRSHPDITIIEQAPAENYNAADQAVIRAMMTNSTPDIYLASYSSLPTIAGIIEDRGNDVALDSLMEQEGSQWQDQNYDNAILQLAKVKDKQVAMPFTASLPLLYVNKELTEKAGGDVDNFPKTWDGVIELAAKISALENAKGISFSVGGLSDDWYWQMMVMGAGAQMLNSDNTGIGYDNAAGMEALRVTQDMATKTNMSVYADPKPAQQQFFAGKVAMVVESPSDLVAYQTAIGERFTMRTVQFPLIDAKNGGLPAGGNALMVLTNDPAKRAAAWQFIKFMTSPETQAEIAKASGYMPVNIQTAKTLEQFYKENPNFQTAFASMPAVRPWFAYPNNTAHDIWKGTSLVLDQLQRGKTTPEVAMGEIKEHVEAVLANQ